MLHYCTIQWLHHILVNTVRMSWYMESVRGLTVSVYAGVICMNIWQQYLIHQAKFSQSAPPVQPYRKSSSGLSQGSRESNSGYQGSPWCSSAWGLFGSLRLSGICPSCWSSFPSSVTYLVERLVLHWAKRLCVHCQLPCDVTYIQHLESCLCIEESERQLS